MKKRLYLLLFGIALGGCQFIPGRTANTPEPEMRTITDQRGKDVAVPKEVKRIVAVPMPAASLLVALDGGADRLVGMNPAAMTAVRGEILEQMYPGITTVATQFTNPAFEVNVEELTTLTPDVVFQWSDRGDGLYAGMEQVGMPVLGLTYGTQADLETWITIMGKVLGKEVRASEFIAYQQKTMRDIAEMTASLSATQKPKVLYLSYGKDLKTTGKGTYNDVVIELVGGQNVAHDLESKPTVTMEQIIAWNPDIILLGNFADTTPADLYTDAIPGQKWSGIRAVKNKQVYRVPLGTYRWDPPNQESPLMWLWLGSIVQPKLFTGSVRQATSDFYTQYYGYSLSDQQLNHILQCDEYEKNPGWCSIAE